MGKQINNQNKIFFIMSFLFIILISTSCSSLKVIEYKKNIDYSNPKRWLSQGNDKSKAIDIFYVYPTVWQKDTRDEFYICDINNETMITGAKIAYERQASAFAPVGNIYAPYYRQADAKYSLSLNEKDRWEFEKEIPALDVITAFDYYINNYNNNKPFILVGHSQGAMTLMILLEDYMSKNPKIYENMVCAYLIGYPITVDFLERNKHLNFAKNANDLNVIISYNTQSKNIEKKDNIILSEKETLVINPINWKTDDTLALASESLGSYMPKSLHQNYKILNFADAQIDLNKNVVICNSVNEEELYKISLTFSKGIYHVFDIPFYYYNLRENAQNRKTLFLKKEEN